MKDDNVKAKIQELCPDIQTRNTSVLIPAPFSGIINHRDDTITLAVVLRAINKADGIVLVRETGTVFNDDDTVMCEWNLEHDNYDQQSEECKQFIGSLLGV